MTPAGKYRCPGCGTGFGAREKHFPFCSERCQLLDLGAWASERYSIKGKPLSEESDGAPAPEKEESTEE